MHFILRHYNQKPDEVQYRLFDYNVPSTNQIFATILMEFLKEISMSILVDNITHVKRKFNKLVQQRWYRLESHVQLIRLLWATQNNADFAFTFYQFGKQIAHFKIFYRAENHSHI